MTLKTPPLHARGLYTVQAPFTLLPNTIYECIAIRTFADFVDVGQDPFKLFYEPLGLTETQYQADAEEGASIITLASDTQSVVYVPDSYITSYPDMTNVAYNQVVLSVSLGPIPDYLDLTFLQSQVAGNVEDVIGVTPEVNLHIAPSTGVVTQSEHDAMEVARQAAISKRTTDRARLLTLQNQLNAAQVKIQLLEQILRDHGLIPE